MRRTISFAVIADAHTQGGDLKFLPSIVDRINALPQRPSFAISLGDCVYGLRENDVLADVRAYQREIARLVFPHYYAIGNHEVEPIEVFGNLTWEQLLKAWALPGRWYSFDCGGFHCCVLDSWLGLQEERYAAVLAEQVQWFADDLSRAQRPVLVFTHEALGFQQCDCQHWIDTDNPNFWPPGNAFEKLILKHCEKIIGVFAGHKHKSLHKTIGPTTFHLFGAGFLHEGQFAQVFIKEDGGCLVKAHPEHCWQNAEETLQQTYECKTGNA